MLQAQKQHVADLEAGVRTCGPCAQGGVENGLQVQGALEERSVLAEELQQSKEVTSAFLSVLIDALCYLCIVNPQVLEEQLQLKQDEIAALRSQNKALLQKEKEALLQVQELYEDIDQYNEVNLRLQGQLAKVTTVS